MTLRIERFSGECETRLQLSGALRSEQLAAVRAEIERSGPSQVILDLNEVDLVDIEAVRFLNICEVEDVKVVNCSHLHWRMDVSRASKRQRIQG